MDALLDDGLVVVVQRDAAGIERARSLESAGLDLEQIEFAVAIGIDPSANGIAEQGRLDGLRPGAPVREDASRVANVLDQDMRGARRDYEFGLAIRIGDTRHAWRHA